MSLAGRDSQRCRDLIDSPWYQEKFGDSFSWLSDQNAKHRYENNFHGYRIATSVEGSATGEGGDIIIVDDPHNIKEGESENVRNGTLQWWDRVMTSRLNDQQTGAMIIIGQRVHENDLIGHLIETGDWDYLCLPAEYESSKKTYTSIGWEDPRTTDGEVLWPEKFPKSVLAYLKLTLQLHYFAQYQQRPTSEEGSILKAGMFLSYTRTKHQQGGELYDAYNLHTLAGDRLVLDSQCRTVVTSDFAVAKTQAADFTCFLVWKVTDRYEFLLTDIVHDKMEAPESEALLETLARSQIRLWTVIVEDVAYQKSIIQRLRRKGVPVTTFKPMVDKVARTQSIAVYFAAGNFFFDDRIASYADYKKETTGFPNATNDDYVDATTILLALFQYGEPRITVYGNEEEVRVIMEEEQAIQRLQHHDPELANFLLEEE
jgi:predicted phage terminase large subunit-like protein